MRSTAFLPETGFVRVRDILRVLPIGRSSWWAGVKSGRFPQPVKLGENTTAWRTEDIHALLAHLSSGNGDEAGPVPVLAAYESVAETLRDGVVEPSASTANSPRWPAAVEIAPDRVALALPFFDTLGAAARHAAQIVVIAEFFGSRVQWASVLREHCHRYRAAVSVEPDPTRCDVLDVLFAATRGFQGVSRAGVALHSADCFGQLGNVEHTVDPDSAARRLIEAVLCPRDCIVVDLATRMTSMQPLGRAELFDPLNRLHDLHEPHDPFAALIEAADRDKPCEWPMVVGSFRWECK